MEIVAGGKGRRGNEEKETLGLIVIEVLGQINYV